MTSERCDIFFTTSGAVRSRFVLVTALIYVRPSSVQSVNLFRNRSRAELRPSRAGRGTAAVATALLVRRERRPGSHSDLTAAREYRPRFSSGRLAEPAMRNRT